MKGFISHIVEHIHPGDLTSLKYKVFVFPSRRACHHFKEALIARFSQETYWIPHILSIEDFIIKCTGKAISSEIDLLFALYEVYSSTYLPPAKGIVDKEELPTFDKFYAWGQILLKDFDEVDRYLVDADLLYRNLEQLRDLENHYADNEEVLFALKRFNEMMGNDPTALTMNFSNQWDRVCKTYHAFRDYLGNSNLRYSGQLYRELAEQLQQQSAELSFKQVIFAGFNALSISEEVIFDNLLKQGRATIYWDADKLYLDDSAEEAGRFMRRNYKKWPPSDSVNWVITDMTNEKKQIQLVGGVQAIGQAQVIGQLLGKLTPEQQDTCGIVLADEGLLFPILYALPETTKGLNVTMGYPVKQSLWFRLASAYMQLQLKFRGKAQNTYIESGTLNDLLTNPLMQRTAPAAVKELQVALQSQKSKWTALSNLISDESPAVMVLAITPKQRVSDLMRSLVELLLTIYQKLRVSEELGELETEFAYHSLKHLIQLEEQIQRHHRQLEPRTLARLVTQAFEQAIIPFSGEPTKGLQLMGFLETRALDFERVILVSVNEGKLPRGIQHNSYIPYAMRKAFHLPTFEEQDAIFAYHFKRVIQRARHVTILYNTQVAVDGSGEKSRFLWQLQEIFPKESIREAIYQMSMPRTMVKAELHIEKSSQILSLMGNYLSGSKVTKPLSPTAFRHYLDCSLRFYFRYIVKLREREQTSKELDARDFGNIVHKALEKIYQPYLDKMVTKTDVRKLMDSQAIAKALDWSMKIHFRKTVFPVLEGKDILHEQIMQKLIFRVLENDLKATPFHLVATELKISGALEFRAGSTVLLEGTLDRVHLANDILHIVDYKTGRADLKNLYRPAFPEKGAEYVQTHFDEPRFKSGFQGLFYGYLWSGDRGYAPLKLGVYPLKKVNEGIRWLNHDRVIPMDGFREFERQLRLVLQELFDESVPFTQTDDPDRCRFCAYKEICQR